MTGDHFAPRHGNLATYHFVRANQAANETNVDYALAGAGTNTLVPMPYSGSVVGLGVRGNAAVTTSSGVWSVHSSGTELTHEDAPTVTLTAGGTDQNGYTRVRPGAVKFSAGDLLGISVTTTATFDPATIEYDCWLYVLFDVE